MKKAEAVLGPMLKRLGIESGVRLELIRKDWESVFDPDISSHMSPASLKEGELLLNVDSPAWMQQLTYYRKEIIRKLSSYGVTDVRFRLGRVSQKKKYAADKRGPGKLSEEDAFYIESAVSEITDDHLRDAIRKAIEKSLMSSKNPKS